MPYKLETHVLTVDANVIHKVDTGNPANLYSMWTVFSRCADSLDQGRRLENLSWRLWQREQLIENQQRAAAREYSRSQPRDVPSSSRLPDVPQLSGSVDSLADDDTLELASLSAPLEIVRPRIRRLESSASRRDRHISSDDFEKMVVSIVKDKAPLSAPIQTVLPMPPKQEKPTLQRSGSSTTESQSSEPATEESQPSPVMESTNDTTTISTATPTITAATAAPATAPTSTSQSVTTSSAAPEPAPAASLAPVDDSIPEPTSSPAPKPVQLKKQPARFAFGGSCSSSEFGQSVENRKLPMPVAKKAMFHMGASSEEESSVQSRRGLPPTRGSIAQQKRISFNSSHCGEDESAVDSDTEGEYVDESAIDDDDDSSDWEDSIDESGKPSMDDKLFQRVESKVNLTSRPSLITLMLAQNERVKTLGNQASLSTSAISRTRNASKVSLGVSPNDSDEGPLMMKGMRQQSSALKPIHEIPRSCAQPIAASANHVYAQAALSPRTTRRNMLATELTESLRRHLLWERQQKSSTANAVLKRRHTSHDVANLKQYPERPCMKQSEDGNASSWNQYFTKEAYNGYHSKGW
ncbi:Uncharacterized protein ESCO_003872 [Escovopsis weberi]|uniref:Uncharacterized protein n=1 Tax=Escovopsis weberi TaxID=150374 RepID=A0A0M8N8B0_ESCWE|nr:Uncharacterized protein ESCO_003872 [Escovopsis weberi]